MAEREASFENDGQDVSRDLGDIAWLYSLSEVHRTWPFESLHQWIMPPLLAQQYRVYRKGRRPVGFVTWAYLTPASEKDYVRNTQSLTADRWSSGSIWWGVDFVAPFGDAKPIIRDLKENIFPDRTGRFLRAKAGSDTLRIRYVHGVNAVAKARGERHISVL